MRRLNLLQPGSHFLYLAHHREGVRPEPEVVVPLRQREGLVGGAVLLLELPVFEGEGQALAVEAQDDVVELVVLRSEVVLILCD